MTGDTSMVIVVAAPAVSIPPLVVPPLSIARKSNAEIATPLILLAGVNMRLPVEISLTGIIVPGVTGAPLLVRIPFSASDTTMILSRVCPSSGSISPKSVDLN